MIHVRVQKSLRGAEGAMQLHADFSVPEKALVVLMGPSGAGKTSLLKMIAGLMQPEAGQITVGGETWFDDQQPVHLPPQQRSVGFVFQEYALFPHMNVRENLTYALQRKEDAPIVDEVLAVMNIQNLEKQRSATLSGGQQQRVALARAIVRRPKILLLDEPFAALDRDMRLKLQDDLLRLHERYQTTTLMISHDMLEVARMADQVILVNDGKIERTGVPEAVLPSMPANTLEGEVVAIDIRQQTLTLAIPHVLGHVVVQKADLVSVKKGDIVRVYAKDMQLKTR